MLKVLEALKRTNIEGPPGAGPTALDSGGYNSMYENNKFPALKIKYNTWFYFGVSAGKKMKLLSRHVIPGGLLEEVAFGPGAEGVKCKVHGGEI